MKDGIHMCYDCLKDGLSLWGFFFLSCNTRSDFEHFNITINNVFSNTVALDSITFC